MYTLLSLAKTSLNFLYMVKFKHQSIINMEDTKNDLQPKKWYRNKRDLLIILTVVLLAGGGWWFFSVVSGTVGALVNQQMTTTVAQNQTAPIVISQILQADDPSLGNDQAPLKVVEFADFNCSVCQREYTVIRELAAKYPDKVQVFWKNYPAVSESSVELAIAGECAAEQRKFWPMHDRLFQLQGVVNSDNLATIAQQIGLDLEKFNQCLLAEESLTKVQLDYQSAQKIEVEGTPTFIVNGYKIQGYVPAEIWEQLVDKASNERVETSN